MTDCRRVACSLCVFFSLVTCGFAQQARSGLVVPQKVPLTQASTVPVPSLPPEGIGPIYCDRGGEILLRLVTPEAGMEDPVSVSADGTRVVRFGKEKIYDVTSPSLVNAFLAESSDVYILTTGRESLGYEAKLRAPSGKVVHQPATKASRFVARFKPDGSYAGAVRLDLPFQPISIGVFADGAFLITGMNSSATQSRAAIVGSDGQVLRLVELRGDLYVADGGDESTSKQKDPNALPQFKADDSSRPSFLDAMLGSQIVSDGSNLLLFRQNTNTVFSVSRSGEVTSRKLKIDSDYRLNTIKTSGNVWFAGLLREVPSRGPAVEFATYAFDPETGNPLREYSLPGDFGFGLACVDGDELTFVMANQETNSLKLVRLRP